MKRFLLFIAVGLLAGCSGYESTDSSPMSTWYGCLSVLVQAPDIVYNGDSLKFKLTMTNECNAPFLNFGGVPTFELYNGDELLRPD